YGPYHEVQAMVMGPAAASLGALARDRWRALGDDRMPPLQNADDDLWPSDIPPDLTDVDVAIARTMPATESRPAIRECEALFLDSIARAKRTLYIENQYFTNDKLAAALAARLADQDGPEVIVISPQECHGWLEKTTMGAFRDSAFRQLLAADRYGRLRLVYPAASRSRNLPTFVHSKVMIVDDVLARIGSANCSHRSMGMDTECDLAVDAGGDSEARAGIHRMRDRLLAEHLGMPIDAVAREIERAGSIGRVIDMRQAAEHTLVRIEMPQQSPAPPAALQAAADPDEPVAFGGSVDSLIPAVDAASGRSPLRLWILPSVVLRPPLPSRGSRPRHSPRFQLHQHLCGLESGSSCWPARCWFHLNCWPLPRVCVSAPCAEAWSRSSDRWLRRSSATSPVWPSELWGYRGG